MIVKYPTLRSPAYNMDVLMNRKPTKMDSDDLKSWNVGIDHEFDRLSEPTVQSVEPEIIEIDEPMELNSFADMMAALKG